VTHPDNLQTDPDKLQTDPDNLQQAQPQRMQQHVVTPALEPTPKAAKLSAAMVPVGFQQGVPRAPTHIPQPVHVPPSSEPPQPIGHGGQVARGGSVARPPGRRIPNNAAQDFLGDLLPGLGLSDMLQATTPPLPPQSPHTCQQFGERRVWKQVQKYPGGLTPNFIFSCVQPHDHR
jgi:hypothetical protein